MKQTWYYALLPGEMALGLFSILLPLYVVGELNGSLVEVGMAAAVAGFSSIPASIFWGYLSDKMRRCKVIVVSSLLILSFLFILLSKVKSIGELLILSAMLGVFRSASPSVAGILIAESTSRSEWDSNVARYRFTLALGSLIGLVTGTLLVASYGYRGLLILGGIFIFTSLILSLFLVEDPPWMVERKFLRFERVVGVVNRVSFIIGWEDRLKPQFIRKFTGSDSPILFCLGVLMFSFATQMTFTPLPIFFLNVGVSSSSIFFVFLFNSLGSLFGYIFCEGWIENHGERRAVQVSSLFRAFLFPLISAFIYLPYTASLTLAILILVLIGVFWSMFTISTNVLCMEIIPEGRVGFYTGVIELGSATGMLVGGFISMLLGFNLLFMLSGILFTLSFIIFKLGLGSSANW